MSKARAGYTFIEMMTVMVIFGVVTGLSIPRLQGATAAAGMRSARLQVSSYLAQARALSLQRGRETRFIRTGNAIRVVVDSSGTYVTYARSHDLYGEHRTSLSSSGITADTIRFDARGFSVGASGLRKIYLTRAGQSDSVCVTKLGKVIQSGCAL